MSKSPVSEEVEATWVALQGEGMQLELSYDVAGKKHYFASFVAYDMDDTLYFEVYVSGQRVRVPVSQLESWIAEAKRDVHPESWYDKSLAGDNDD